MCNTFPNCSEGFGSEQLEKGALPASISDALDFARAYGATGPVPGGGSTLKLWEFFARLGAHDLGIARAVEPHIDAVAILRQAGHTEPEGAWGVFAAEGGDDPLCAIEGPGGWTLTGTKPWCSLALHLDHALVTARTAPGESRLFAVDLNQPNIEAREAQWVSRGLAEIPSGPTHFSAVPATPVGDPGWYVNRVGFRWGAIGVSACWLGGAMAIVRTVSQTAQRSPNPHLLAHLGAMDTLLHACWAVLRDAASQVDEHADDARILSKRVRGLIARSCEEIIIRSGHALGPAPLTVDSAHAKRVADLQIYIRQHHAERDDAALGAILTESDNIAW